MEILGFSKDFEGDAKRPIAYRISACRAPQSEGGGQILRVMTDAFYPEYTVANRDAASYEAVEFIKSAFDRWGANLTPRPEEETQGSARMREFAVSPEMDPAVCHQIVAEGMRALGAETQEVQAIARVEQYEPHGGIIVGEAVPKR